MKFINLVEVNFWVIPDQRCGGLVTSKPPVSSCRSRVSDGEDSDDIPGLGKGGSPSSTWRQTVIRTQATLSQSTYSEVSIIEPVVISLLKEVCEAIVVLHSCNNVLSTISYTVGNFTVIYIIRDPLPVGYWSERRWHLNSIYNIMNGIGTSGNQFVSFN